MYLSIPPPRAWPAALPALLQASRADSTRAGIAPVTLSGPELRTLLVIVACGAAGALAADLVADGGRLDRWKQDAQGWTLGFLGKLIVGSVAAVVALTLNPPEGSWSLVGSALAAGVGGEAILLAIVASRQAQGAEREAEHQEDVKSRLAVLAQTRLYAMVDAHHAAGGPARAGAPEGARAAEPDPAGAAQLRVLEALADQFSREIAMFAASPRTRRAGTVRERVRAVLEEVLGRDDVEGLPLRELAGHGRAALRAVADELAVEFPRAQPPVRPGDVKPGHTLDTLAAEIQGRLG
ncbi:MAG TPA: DUF4257 domain-containing protein [Longimicrobiaceae bacterium]|jgi:hypothetical protein